MARDDRDDPFGDIFDEIERMMNEVTGNVDETGFGTDTHVDVHTKNGVRLVADLPGVSKDEISLQCDGKTLTITATGTNREYDEQVRLPVRVDEHSASATFNNGVLQVEFDRMDDSASINVD
jgi:Molecular chaperone (small heat shock protein)